jgi:hypothetical protein
VDRKLERGSILFEFYAPPITLNDIVRTSTNVRLMSLDTITTSMEQPITTNSLNSWLGFAISNLALIVSIVVYRRFFPPLSDVPGPFWASFSRLWHIKITLQHNQSKQLTQAHEKYGYFVRLANNEVSVSHPDAIRKVLLAPLEKVCAIPQR